MDLTDFMDVSWRFLSLGWRMTPEKCHSGLMLVSTSFGMDVSLSLNFS